MRQETAVEKLREVHDYARMVFEVASEREEEIPIRVKEKIETEIYDRIEFVADFSGQMADVVEDMDDYDAARPPINAEALDKVHDRWMALSIMVDGSRDSRNMSGSIVKMAQHMSLFGYSKENAASVELCHTRLRHMIYLFGLLEKSKELTYVPLPH